MRTTRDLIIAGIAAFTCCGWTDAFAAGDVTEERVLAEAAKGNHWFLKGGSFRGEHFSPLAEINRETVADLGLAWSTGIPAPDGIAATPIVVDDVIYFSAAYSVAFAVNARDGRILWSFDPEVRTAFAKWPELSWRARAHRGLAVWDGRVFVTTADCRLIALDAADGKALWSERTCDPDLGYGISDSPYVGGGKVFVGNAGSESGEKNRGYASAYDARTGRPLWRFYTVPSDKAEENTTPAMKLAAKTWSGTALAEFGGGGSNWNEMTYDPESNLLFFGTAGALPYVHSLRSPEGGDNLFLSSVLAVDADSGDYVWHYQTVPEDSWDYNATMNIVLADLVIGGKERKALLIAPKNGFFYVLDRTSGELLSAEKFSKVNWATHINLETGRPVYDPAAEYWKPGEGGQAAVWPNMWGAHSWNPMAYHPGERLAYIPVVDIPSIATWRADGEFTDTLEMFREVDGRPFSPGKLLAWDPIGQRARWVVEREFPFNGGVLATAGGLVFQGDALGAFEAFAADDGERLWRVLTGSGITAAPVSYASGGKQHILIPVGGGGGLSFAYPQMHAGDRVQGPTRIMAFTLGGPQDIPALVAVPRSLPEQPELRADPQSLEAGESLYATNCYACHGKHAIGRYGSSVPDLRYATRDTHAAWHAIVIGGTRKLQGMPPFPLEIAQSEAIRNYVLSRARALRGEDGEQ